MDPIFPTFFNMHPLKPIRIDVEELFWTNLNCLTLVKHQPSSYQAVCRPGCSSFIYCFPFNWNRASFNLTGAAFSNRVCCNNNYNKWKKLLRQFVFLAKNSALSNKWSVVLKGYSFFVIFGVFSNIPNWSLIYLRIKWPITKPRPWTKGIEMNVRLLFAPDALLCHKDHKWIMSKTASFWRMWIRYRTNYLTWSKVTLTTISRFGCYNFCQSKP